MRLLALALACLAAAVFAGCTQEPEEAGTPEGLNHTDPNATGGIQPGGIDANAPSEAPLGAGRDDAPEAGDATGG